MELLKVHQVSEVYELIAKAFKPLENKKKVPLFDAVHCVLAEDVQSTEDVPGFHRSTVDGYAVKAANTFGSSESMPSFFQIVGRIEMGQGAMLSIGEGQAAYVPTGGMLPEGADAVVMIEDVEEVNDLLNVYTQVAPNENVVTRGEDVKENQVILRKGQRIRPQDLGALAAIGITEVPVVPRLKIGILSTGDEIVPPETKKLLPGQIRDINGLTIGSYAKTLGMEVIYGGIVQDDYDTYLNRSKELFDQVDFLLLSGGSSMGTKDYTSRVMNELGSPGVFVHGISIKPGKPTIIANCNGKPVMGLPGHPVSAMVLFELFGKHIMDVLTGVEQTKTSLKISAKIARNVPSEVGRTDYVRVELEMRDDQLWAIPVFGKSGLITNLVKSDGLAEIPQYKDGIAEGETVHVILYR